MDIKVDDVWKTRNGQKTRVICINRITHLDDDNKIVVLIQNRLINGSLSGGESIYTCDSDGRIHGNKFMNGLDLVEPWREPIRVCGWVNVYPNGWNSSLYSSKDEAKVYACSDIIATIYVSGKQGIE